LEQDELRPAGQQIFLHARPSLMELRILRARQQRHIEFGTASRASAGLVRMSRPGIQITPVFVDVGEHQVRVIFEGIEHAIAVVSIDIDIRYALQPVTPA
jgi:hypothetical protein